MRSLTRRLFALPALLACFVSAGILVEASQVRSLNLEDLAGRADRIFAGRCLSVRSIPHPQLGAVEQVTFEVEESIKGQLGSRLTIRMLPSRQSVAGPSQFKEGERVLLFLYRDSDLGLTSPVAMGQGRFSIVTDKQGRSVAVNPRGGGPLVRGLSEEARGHLGDAVRGWESKSDLPLSDLIRGTKALLDAPGGAAHSHDNNKDAAMEPAP